MIDVDVMQRERQKVIDYLREKYGYVYQVRTFSAMKAKSALQKAGMCLGVEPSVIRALSKLLSDVAGKEPEEIAKFDDIPITKDNEQLIKLAKAFVGIVSNTGVHASAVLVFPKDPTLFCTLEKQGDILVASYDYHELEELGLAKIDVLGLKNMDIIEDTIQLLAERGIVVDIDKIPLDDKKTSEMLCRKETDGVFQIESKIMKGIVNGIQPTCFQDLTAVVALGRPGPLQSGMVEEYINERKHFIKKNN